MAMLSKEELFMVQHYLKEGLPKMVIARKLGISRMTVYRHAEASKKLPVFTARKPKPLIIDPFKDYIQSRLSAYPELSAVRLFSEITILGYKGKYTTLKNFIRSIRPKAPFTIEQRFEVYPGQQAQVDFATFKTSFGMVHALLVVLSYSRYLWVRFYSHEDQLTVLSGLHQAFLAFGGVPQTILFDRMKTAVASSDVSGKAIFNEEMLRFAHHYGFQPTACRPYRAKTKGRVERAVSYLRHNFFYGRSFRDMDDLNNQVTRWLAERANTRIHGTTGEIPHDRLLREQKYLISSNTEFYMPTICVGRRLSLDGFISYNGNSYSVPEGVDGREIEVRATLEEVALYRDGRIIARHPHLIGKGQRHLAPEHRRNLLLHLRHHEVSSNSSSEFIEVQHRPLDIYEKVLL
jgi:transposase